MIKSFSELSKFEVSITKKPRFKYDKAKKEMVKDGEIDTISWVDCLKALYENGAEKVTYENIPNKDGGLLYHDDNGCMHILIFVDIDGDRRELFYPLIDGTKVIKADSVTQSDIYNAKQRAFVKCVALNWGLGIETWKKEDAEENIHKEEKTLCETFRGLLNKGFKFFGSATEMVKHFDKVSEKRLLELVETSKEIDGIMKILEKTIDDKESR